MNELGIVDRVQAHELGVSHEHRDRPRAHEHGAQRARELGARERRALLEEGGQAPVALRVGDLEPGELATVVLEHVAVDRRHDVVDRKSTRLNSSHSQISYAVFCLKKKKSKLYSRHYEYQMKLLQCKTYPTTTLT